MVLFIDCSGVFRGLLKEGRVVFQKKYGVGRNLGVTSLVGFGDVFRYGLGYDDMT